MSLAANSRNSEKIIVAPSVRDLDRLGVQVSGWLASRLNKAEHIVLSNLNYPSGAGQSHETILFDAAWTTGGQRHAEGLVIRIKPTEHLVYPDDLFDNQYRLMRLMHENAWAPVAETLWFEEDPSLVGAPFFVMKRLQGQVAVSHPPYAQSGWVKDATPEQRARIWENGVRTLASLQKIPLAQLNFLAGQNGLTGLEQEWAKYERFLAWVSQGRRWPILEAARDQLRARWPANRPPGFVWGDARLGNLMFNNHFDVIAVMDLEQPSLGGALNDLAWWLYLGGAMHGHERFEGMGSRAQTIALWQQITGVSTEDLEWYEDFTALKVGLLSIRTAAIKAQPMPDHSWLAKLLGLPSAA